MFLIKGDIGKCMLKFVVSIGGTKSKSTIFSGGFYVPSILYLMTISSSSTMIDAEPNASRLLIVS